MPPKNGGYSSSRERLIDVNFTGENVLLFNDLSTCCFRTHNFQQNIKQLLTLCYSLNEVNRILVYASIQWLVSFV
jgi:hypothetical protein